MGGNAILALAKTEQLRQISHIGGGGRALKPKIKGKSHIIWKTSLRAKKKEREAKHRGTPRCRLPESWKKRGPGEGKALLQSPYDGRDHRTPSGTWGLVL